MKMLDRSYKTLKGDASVKDWDVTTRSTPIVRADMGSVLVWNVRGGAVSASRRRTRGRELPEEDKSERAGRKRKSNIDNLRSSFLKREPPSNREAYRRFARVDSRLHRPIEMCHDVQLVNLMLSRFALRAIGRRFGVAEILNRISARNLIAKI
jgi:hypothetical protein